jgi:glycosyltransferase involved in cell wall biosynthesis
MKASVVVIDYKRKKYILDALQSIKNQKGIDLIYYFKAKGPCIELDKN